MIQGVSMRRSRAKGQLFIAVGAMLFGTTGASQYYAPEGIDPITTGALRLAIGGPLLCFLAIGLRHHPIQHMAVYFRMPLAVGVAGVVTFQACFFNAVQLTGVAVGTLVAMGSAPILAGIGGCLFFNESLGIKWSLAAALTLLGCALLALPESNAITMDMSGIVLALAAGCGYALIMLASKRLLDTGSALGLMAIMLTFGAVIFLPRLISADWHLWLTPRGIGVALWLGVAATGMAYFFLALGLATIPVSHVALMTLIEPLVACILGVLVLGERLTPYAAIGMGAIFCGLVLASLRWRRKEKPAALNLPH
jgi:drug/metabolite transporter, DME family